MVNINGVELEFDIYDLDTAKRYEAALKGLGTESSELQPGASLVESIEKECNMTFQFLDLLFGEGTSNKVFGSKCNLNACLEAVEAVTTDVSRQRSALDDRVQKYIPKQEAIQH